MSHAKQRKEKNCLNCGTTVAGRYCQHCGQENIEPKETVWGLVSHFLHDITHFDGKFFSTLKLLITRPGFLSKQYISGRRASYLHPVRMYVFTSAFFFVIFFLLFNPAGYLKKDKELQLAEIADARANLEATAPGIQDTVMKAAVTRAIAGFDHQKTTLRQQLDQERRADSLKALLPAKKAAQVLDSSDLPALGLRGKGEQANPAPKKYWSVAAGDNPIVDSWGLTFKSEIAYDAVQKELPEAKKDKWLIRSLKRHAMSVNTRWRADRREAISLFLEKFMHTLPQALFVSLPFFAMLLWLLYARRKYYYTDHAIFSIHLYCAVFMLLLVYFGFDKLGMLTGWGIFGVLRAFLIIGIFVYLYKAMRGFYQQGRGKTIAKFLILYFLSAMLVSGVVLLFFLWALWQF